MDKDAIDTTVFKESACFTDEAAIRACYPAITHHDELLILDDRSVDCLWDPDWVPPVAQSIALSTIQAACQATVSDPNIAFDTLPNAMRQALRAMKPKVTKIIEDRYPLAHPELRQALQNALPEATLEVRYRSIMLQEVGESARLIALTPDPSQKTANMKRRDDKLAF